MQVSSSLSLADVCSQLGLLDSAVLDVSQHSSRYYTRFERPKRTGGTRLISASKGTLKSMQRALLDGLLSGYSLPEHVQGCVRGRSPVTNARIHVGQPVVVNIDLVDFFGSVSFDMIAQVFIERFRFDEEAAEIFARLTVSGGGLPQGAPTSPYLANLAALELDNAIMRYCDQTVGKDNFRYSRYVDDITISGALALQELLPSIYECIVRNGFMPNVNKTRVLRRSIRQSVTGVVVNEHANVPKTLIRHIRQQLYYCEKWGLKEHCETRGIAPASFVRELRGKIGYIGAIRPDLATEFALTLRQAAQDLEESEEEHNLQVLKGMIDRDLLAQFYYGYSRERHRAAPAGIQVDPEGELVVRAFQLEPEQGWKYFAIAGMRRLKVSTSS